MRLLGGPPLGVHSSAPSLFLLTQVHSDLAPHPSLPPELPQLTGGWWRAHPCTAHVPGALGAAAGGPHEPLPLAPALPALSAETAVAVTFPLNTGKILFGEKATPWSKLDSPVWILKVTKGCEGKVGACRRGEAQWVPARVWLLGWLPVLAHVGLVTRMQCACSQPILGVVQVQPGRIGNSDLFIF